MDVMVDNVSNQQNSEEQLKLEPKSQTTTSFINQIFQIENEPPKTTRPSRKRRARSLVQTPATNVVASTSSSLFLLRSHRQRRAIRSEEKENHGTFGRIVKKISLKKVNKKIVRSNVDGPQLLPQVFESLEPTIPINEQMGEIPTPHSAAKRTRKSRERSIEILSISATVAASKGSQRQKSNEPQISPSNNLPHQNRRNQDRNIPLINQEHNSPGPSGVGSSCHQKSRELPTSRNPIPMSNNIDRRSSERIAVARSCQNNIPPSSFETSTPSASKTIQRRRRPIARNSLNPKPRTPEVIVLDSDDEEAQIVKPAPKLSPFKPKKFSKQICTSVAVSKLYKNFDPNEQIANQEDEGGQRKIFMFAPSIFNKNLDKNENGHSAIKEAIKSLKHLAKFYRLHNPNKSM